METEINKLETLDSEDKTTVNKQFADRKVEFNLESQSKTEAVDDNEDEDSNHVTRRRGKHSSGDLHSRLKTRKLLGVGETDDGDVHRSKLSQILGHSDQLYIKLPGGLRIWQVVLSVLFSVMSVWALLFPTHYFHTMFEVDGSTFTFPIRLYATALVCISVMYWSTVQAADRDVIRLVMLSSVVFFILQTLVLLPWSHPSPKVSFMCSLLMFSVRLVIVCVSSYYYWVTYKDRKSKEVRYYR